MSSNVIYEKDVVSEFSSKLGLLNQTDGTLFIYGKKKGISTKPDGYYYYNGITFILDAKRPGYNFTDQLKDYMNEEKNENYVGFEYDGASHFTCYIHAKGDGPTKKIASETFLKHHTYYSDKYFPIRINNEEIVENSAKNLAKLFRDSKIDKQMNVPFIGAVMLCMKFSEFKNMDKTNNKTIVNSLKNQLDTIIPFGSPEPKIKKRDFIKTTLENETLLQADYGSLYHILREIQNIYNFINISKNDLKGHDIMNSFLKIFRRWNSANSNEKGEVFTPDHIAQLMYRITKCSKKSLILDPTCGSGTFLINAMANMWLETDDPAEKTDIATQLFGIESSTFNTTLACINMMLHGDGISNIYNENCFHILPTKRIKYDRVLMNPPFSQIDAELRFVLVTLENMENEGYLSAIVPKTCVNGRDDKNKNWMKKIFDISNLVSVISLPNKLFIPNASVATCIITLHKTNKVHSLKNTLLVNLSDDGYELIRNKHSRFNKSGKWEEISRKVIEIFKSFEDSNNTNELNFDDKIAVLKQLKYSDELLFESYSSYRPNVVSRETFSRYIREYVSSKVLCGMTLTNNIPHSSLMSQAIIDEKVKISEFEISKILKKCAKGKVQSIDRTLEDKYELEGTPLIIAKKDNNGVGGMKYLDNDDITYTDKFCIIAGGDGGGGKTYYCNFSFSATSFVLVCDVTEIYKDKIDVYAKFYLAIMISEKLHKTVNHGRTISDVPSNIKIDLPVKEDGNIDFNYMSDYIKSLQYSNFI